MRNTTKVLITITLILSGGAAGIAGMFMLVSVAKSVYQAAAENHRDAAIEGPAPGFGSPA